MAGVPNSERRHGRRLRILSLTEPMASVEAMEKLARPNEGERQRSRRRDLAKKCATAGGQEKNKNKRWKHGRNDPRQKNITSVSTMIAACGVKRPSTHWVLALGIRRPLPLGWG